ncbi:hypothetical protein [Actinacidiphila acididurans]|uniref:Zinc-finger domain-containing protein n=1 Tax=Actinacidiphila acididurans TaxID=2784346 RepID=A0ABS2TVH7_9ACTN|nr:hypothetical protein [Actinacidiphila acididurans]MBM9505958.1 hypothetical protein [Actinacidiphila acididurans]
MTSPGGTDPHPEVAEISALSEGLLPVDRSTEVNEHLDDCELCSDVLVSLMEIRGLLGTLPGPPPMPEDIAGRIDAALAAEALLSATDVDVPRGTTTQESAESDVPRGTEPWAVPRGTEKSADGETEQSAAQSDVPRETSTPVPRETSTRPDRSGSDRTRPGGRPETPTGPGRTSLGSHPIGRRRLTWHRGLLAAASALAVLLVGGLVLYGVTSAGGGSNLDSSSGQSRAAGSKGSDQVGERVRALLSEPGKKADTPMLTGQGTHTDAAPGGLPAVPSCVLKATHRTELPLASDHESFQGTDSYLVVLPHPGDAHEVDAFVVTADCTTAGPGAVLFRHTYPR